MIIPSNLLSAISFLCVQQNNDFVVVGTAFQIIIVEENFTFAYFVTCKHVVDSFLKNGTDIFVRLNRSSAQEVSYKRLDTNWVYHDSEAVDLAVLLLIPTGDSIALGAYGIDGILTRHQQNETGLRVSLGLEVFFIGLFQQYIGYAQNMPIVRHGRIALVTDELLHGPYGETDYYIIECQAHPGNSGSPVLIPVRTANHTMVEWRILGVINGYFTQINPLTISPLRDINGKAVPITGHVTAHSGISLVTPADHIVEILNKENLLEKRRKRVGAGRMNP